MTAGRVLRKWRHSRKGLIQGYVIREDEEWMDVELAQDHSLSYAAESNRGRVDEAGEVLTVRKSLMREIT